MRAQPVLYPHRRPMLSTAQVGWLPIPYYTQQVTSYLLCQEGAHVTRVLFISCTRNNWLPQHSTATSSQILPWADGNRLWGGHCDTVVYQPRPRSGRCIFFRHLRLLPKEIQRTTPGRDQAGGWPAGSFRLCEGGRMSPQLLCGNRVGEVKKVRTLNGTIIVKILIFIYLHFHRDSIRALIPWVVWNTRIRYRPG